MTADIQISGSLPGQELKTEKMPAHWLLARLGKRVLRPGGRQLTHWMLKHLDIQASDEVVEFAPGLGETARLTLDRKPFSYTAVERDRAAAAMVQQYLKGPHQQCVVGLAAETGLPAASATVVYGEAMLSMQLPVQKDAIVRESFRLLEPGGRYGIHELCVVPDDLSEKDKLEIQNALSQVLHHGANLLTGTEWRSLLEAQGFVVQEQHQAPMHLLEPWRLVQDEGVWGAVKFVCNVACNRDARRRVLAMRQFFRTYRDHLMAIGLIGHKPKEITP
jgi:ubiquinone/menaquinone biosynthesis C-methylase UbiE